MKTKRLLGLAAAAFFGMSAYAQEPGDYFFKNVESGRYLNGANNWGTKASVTVHGQLMTLAAVDGGFTIDSHYSNGGNAHYLASGDNTFVDANPATHTLEAQVDGSYAIKDSNGKYLSSDGSLVNFNSDVINGASKWLLISKADVLKAAESASEDNPVDFTGFIGDANFGRNNQYVSAWIGTGIDPANKHTKPIDKGGNNDNMCIECYHKAFDSYQTITGVPNGKYRMTAQGFYRQDGSDNTNLPYFSINGEKSTFPLKTGTENSMADASTSFSNGSYKIEPIEVIVSNGTITLGAKCEQTSLWCIWDNFELTYLGKVTDLSAYKDGFDKAVADATGVDQNAPMNASVLSDLKSALSTYNVDFSTFTSADDISTAVTALSNAANAAEASVANYAAVTAKLNTLDAAGKAVFLATEVGQKYSGKTYTNEDCTSEFATAAKAQGAGADMTLAIANPTIVNNGANTSCPAGWTESTHSGWSWTKATGDTYMENWNENAVDASFDFHQTITGLPNGTYKVTADMFANRDNQEVEFVSGDYVVYGVSANEAQAGVTVEGGDFNTYVTGDVYVVDGTLVIGVKNVHIPSVRWFGADNFKLTYVATTYPDEYNPEIVAAQKLANAVKLAEELVNDKMNATCASDLATAIANGKKTYDTAEGYTAATDAVNKAKAAAETSVSIYKDIAVYNAKAAALGAVGQASYASTLAAYNAGTLTTVAEAETAYAEAYAAYNEAAYKAVTSKGTDMTSAIVNPSFEENGFDGWTCANDGDTGAKDNSNGTFTMSGCDGAKVFNTWRAEGAACAPISQTITGLKAGRYAIVATMASDAAHELYVSLNDGTHGTATTTDKGTGVVVSAEGEIAVGSEELTIKAGTTDGGWFKADNFKLVLLEEYAAPVIADLTVNDGVAVAESQDAKNITYVREFKAANKWQSLYLPFSVNLEKNEADVVLAKVDDVVEDNGELVINIVKVSATETVEACKPLFIAAKTVGVKNIKTGVSTVASPNDGGNDYSAAEFTGILSEARAGQAGRYVMSGGELCLVPQSMNNLTLGVNRWAMIVNGGNGVRIRINAEGFNADEATAIANAVAESVENGEIFSINGAKVKDAKSGLFIKGGKKVFVK